MITRTEQHEVRRDDDGELLGFVAADDRSASWRALTVFGGVLGEHSDAGAARQQVHVEGLASLAERWWCDLGDGWEACSLVEASPERVVVIRRDHSFDATPVVLPKGTHLRLVPPT